MARLCQALLLLTITVTLESSTVQAWGSPKVVRPFQDISSSYVYVQQAVWYAKKEYNKANKDKYSFRVVEILKSQEQVTDSLEYYVEAKITRTMCLKTAGENEHWLFQKNLKIKRRFFASLLLDPSHGNLSYPC
ncbi:cystatin-13-like isoform X1 [Heterocephalus glaber]|uniref:Cystatin-13-like isoform X1 n=1 Tax=Heterocephalus glaber TaxID=10181 RepID=A0AAX6SLU4_HETGA|nr:cystatin-13-like isoform X1 [Heterocephalus glaber]